MLQSAKCGTTVVLIDNSLYSMCRDGRETDTWDGLRFPLKLSLCFSQWSLFEPKWSYHYHKSHRV